MPGRKPFLIAAGLFEQTQLENYLGSLAPCELEGYESDRYATVKRIAVVIDRILTELLGLGDDYKLSYKVEDA